MDVMVAWKLSILVFVIVIDLFEFTIKKQERKDNADIEIHSEHLWRVEIELKRNMVDYWNDCFNDLHILQPNWTLLKKGKRTSNGLYVNS